jgi:hypothetical protein
MSDRIHVPPSSWVTFEAPGFVVLSIPPQIAVADLEAEELPSYGSRACVGHARASASAHTSRSDPLPNSPE